MAGARERMEQRELLADKRAREQEQEAERRLASARAERASLRRYAAERERQRQRDRETIRRAVEAGELGSRSTPQARLASAYADADDPGEVRDRRRRR